MVTDKKSLANYVNKATNLAELVKNNIQKNNNKIDEKTILALNEFIIAANEIKDLIDYIEKDNVLLN